MKRDICQPNWPGLRLNYQTQVYKGPPCQRRAFLFELAETMATAYYLLRDNISVQEKDNAA
jgi:hypothetical protein